MKVLIVDDEPGVLTTLEIMLYEHGHVVSSCAGVDEALKAIRKERFDIVIADIFMPDGDGVSLITDILKEDDKNQCETKILAISGGQPAWLQKSERHHLKNMPDTLFADGFISKPFNSKELKSEMTRLMNKKGPEKTILPSASQ